MKKTTIATIPSTTIGLDLSDRTFQFSELNAAGEIVDEGQLRLNRAAVLGYLSAKSPGARVALETGGHSTWVREVIEQVGHEAVEHLEFWRLRSSRRTSFARSKTESVVQTAVPASKPEPLLQRSYKEDHLDCAWKPEESSEITKETEFPLRRPSKAPIAERCSPGAVEQARQIARARLTEENLPGLSVGGRYWW